MTCKPALHQRRLFSSLTVLSGGVATFAAASLYQGNESFYNKWLMPAVHRVIDAETAHRMAVQLAKYGVVPRATRFSAEDGKLLETTLFGVRFTNPLGLAAGFDKNGEGLRGLCKMGFGLLEVGSVTPEPQEGNPRPRVFRLIRDKAIINRYGFNSDGHVAVLRNLHLVARSLAGEERTTRVGVNLGKNKSSLESSDEDYIRGLRFFADCDVIDYFVINVSSPNTPGLRRLQQKEQLSRLLDAVADARREAVDWRKPVLLKISPDLSPDERQQVCEVIVKANEKRRTVDGIIVSNTTTSRPENSQEELIDEVGGLSGAPLRSLSTEAIAHVYRLTRGCLPIIGCGGVFTGDDAFEKIKAGASLVQIYTSFAIQGPPVVAAINRRLVSLLRENGFQSVSQAVGTGHGNENDSRLSSQQP